MEMCVTHPTVTMCARIAHSQNLQRADDVSVRAFNQEFKLYQITLSLSLKYMYTACV